MCRFTFEKAPFNSSNVCDANSYQLIDWVKCKSPHVLFPYYTIYIHTTISRWNIRSIQIQIQICSFGSVHIRFRSVSDRIEFNINLIWTDLFGTLLTIKIIKKGHVHKIYWIEITTFLTIKLIKKCHRHKINWAGITRKFF